MWHFERCIGWPLKDVAAALGGGDRRWKGVDVNIVEVTQCNKRWGLTPWWNMTINQMLWTCWKSVAQMRGGNITTNWTTGGQWCELTGNMVRHGALRVRGACWEAKGGTTQLPNKWQRCDSVTRGWVAMKGGGRPMQLLFNVTWHDIQPMDGGSQQATTSKTWLWTVINWKLYTSSY